MLWLFSSCKASGNLLPCLHTSLDILDPSLLFQLLRTTWQPLLANQTAVTDPVAHYFLFIEWRPSILARLAPLSLGLWTSSKPTLWFLGPRNISRGQKACQPLPAAALLFAALAPLCSGGKQSARFALLPYTFSVPLWHVPSTRNNQNSKLDLSNLCCATEAAPAASHSASCKDAYPTLPYLFGKARLSDKSPAVGCSP